MAKYLKYLAPFTLPLVIVLALTQSGSWTWAGALYIFGLLPLLDALIPGNSKNLSEIEEARVAKDRGYDYLLYAMVPVQFALLIFFLFSLQEEGLSRGEWLGRIFSMGMACGVLGINVAHELGHRPKKSEQRMAKALLLTSLYTHFFIEHNRGHHKHVSTPEDPASARKGEWVYAFWFRSILFSYLSAWKLEAQRLKKKGHKFFSWENEMIRFSLLQFALLATILVVFDPWVLLGFVLAAIVGMLLLESVNYLEHYGLQRQQLASGKYERVRPIHSWNSNHPVGRLFLFELTRHSDHHYQARRKYQVLRHFDEAPQLPSGYPAMILLALLPPLWFWVMHPRLKRLVAPSTQLSKA